MRATLKAPASVRAFLSQESGAPCTAPRLLASGVKRPRSSFITMERYTTMTWLWGRKPRCQNGYLLVDKHTIRHVHITKCYMGYCLPAILLPPLTPL
jgi:hypothetical protein